MEDPPRKSRRSSISEHIQRVFSVDRSDRKRSDGFQADRANAALVPKSEITIGFELCTGSTTAGDTVPSSFTHSPLNSRLPSVSTPGSSPPVHPVRAKDELPRTMASDGNAPETKANNNNNNNINATHNAKNAEVDLICRSPTWEKDINRKERRATKRLEAERKELEKRLSLLEDAQLKLDQGIYERNSRRLTKKQPLGSSTRSSSANTERPRSSSFTSLFSSKRRSRSRASSMNGSDKDSRNSLENGPPMIPLSLPEQFGTAVSRELASRHGTSLVPSHQMPRTLHHTSAKSDDLRENWKMAEEWKRKNGGMDQDQAMAKTKAPARFGIVKSSIARPTKSTSTNESQSQSPPYGHPPRNSVPPSQPNPPPTSQATELSADLDRDSFTAALRNEKNPPGVASRNPNSSSIPHGNPHPRKNQATKTQPENCPPASVIAARHLSNVSNASSETSQSLTSPKPFQGPTGLTAPSMGNFPKKGRLDGSPKTYKSSPLALNPFTNKDVDRKQENSPIPTTAQPITHGNTEQQGQGRMNANGSKKPSPSLRPVADNPPTVKVHTSTPATPRQQRPASYSFEDSPAKTKATSFDSKVEQMSRDAKLSPLMVPPLKHSGRRSNTMSSLSKASDEKQETPVVTEISTPAPAPAPVSESATPPATTAAPASVPVSDSADLKNDSTRKVYQLSDGGPGNTSLPSVHRPGHSRTSSHSSYGGSSYDTADEEVLDISKAHTKTKPHQMKPQTSHHTSPKSSPNRVPTSQASQKNQTPPSPDTYPIMAMRYPEPNGPINPIPNQNQNSNPNKPKEIPPLSPNGPIAMIRQNLVQRTKKPQKDQVIAKLFVICCSCKYWHDMPSEIYARLACPERIPSESRLVRTFSRKSSSQRRNSIFSSDPSGRGGGGLPTQLRIQQQQQQQQQQHSPGKLAAGTGTGNGNAAQLEKSNGSLPFTPVQCCWCGHGMTRTCCQGWTTLVQMRDRHH